MGAFRVGLTGGLASGKSTVAAIFRRAGFTVLDADRVVSDLYAPEGAGTRGIQELFGTGLLTPDGAVDKDRLTRRVFADAEARRRVEAIVHPLVRERFRELAAATPGIVALEATLLVEAGYAPEFDWIVTVEADPRLRLARAMSRGMTRADAEARLAAQGDGAARRAAAHRVLINERTPEELAAQAADAVSEIRRAAAAAAQTARGR